jgi:hypothetical protein
MHNASDKGETEMAQEIELTKEQAAALDRIEAELTGPQAETVAALDASDLCKKYQSIRDDLLTLIKILKLIPKFGAKAAAALEFLMSLADKLCPA